MSPAISFSGKTSRGPFYELILKGEKVLTTRYPRLKGRIEAGDLVNLYWKQRQPMLFIATPGNMHYSKPIHKIGEAYVVNVSRVFNLLDAILTIPDYIRGEGFRDLAELHGYWGTNTVTATQTGPLDVIRFKLKVK